MNNYTAHIIGPRGSSRRIDILADDMTHARELARDHGMAAYGRQAFSFIVRVA